MGACILILDGVEEVLRGETRQERERVRQEKETEGSDRFIFSMRCHVNDGGASSSAITLVVVGGGVEAEARERGEG